jgi:3-deoxy-7-phosphoheptulonate synthase
MILILDQQIPDDALQTLSERLKFMGLHAVVTIENGFKTIAIVNGMDSNTKMEAFTELPYVEQVLPFNKRFKLVGRDLKKSNTVIEIDGHKIGDGSFTVMSGPCAIESREQIMRIASEVSALGATVLRGGAFKPRTSPYDFQGLGEEGLQYMRDAADAHKMLCISEVMATEDVDMVSNYVDILQLGARNMQNYNLLKKVGKANTPVLLKRGMCATYNEFLLAAEYILSFGNPNVMLCERGIRTFETYSRNCLDIAAVPILKELTHLPIIIDPSHGTGLRHAVGPMAKAAMAVDADGVIVESHYDPDNAVSDAKQTLSMDMLADMMKDLRRMGDALDRPIAT